MSTDLSIINLIANASFVVQLVIAILVLSSFFSWTLILVKRAKLAQARRITAKFDAEFWSGISLNSLYDSLSEKTPRLALERIFYDGFHEYKRIHSAEASSNFPVVDAVGRTMRIAITREVSRLEQNLSFLATVGSTAPYIGLFGTVWGIMNAFLSISQTQQATLSVVAPGIAEALIATAFGLFAAIPASIAYNRFNDAIDHLDLEYENFKDEFLSLLERQVLLKRG